MLPFKIIAFRMPFVAFRTLNSMSVSNATGFISKGVIEQSIVAQLTFPVFLVHINYCLLGDCVYKTWAL